MCGGARNGCASRHAFQGVQYELVICRPSRGHSVRPCVGRSPNIPCRTSGKGSDESRAAVSGSLYRFRFDALDRVCVNASSDRIANEHSASIDTGTARARRSLNCVLPWRSRQTISPSSTADRARSSAGRCRVFHLGEHCKLGNVTDSRQRLVGICLRNSHQR